MQHIGAVLGTVFADIPGLIAGAAQGAGLGHDFLRHIQRTRLLIHLVDASSDDVVRDLAVVEQELELHRLWRRWQKKWVF